MGPKMLSPETIAERVYAQHHSQAAEAIRAEIIAHIEAGILADREQRND